MYEGPYTASVYQVKLLIPDRDLDNELFGHREIEAFLSLEHDNVKRAAALALETIASDQVLMLKMVKTQDMSLDGPAVGKALLTRATILRVQADTDEAAESGGAFDWAETVYDDFTRRERLEAEVLRGG